MKAFFTTVLVAYGLLAYPLAHANDPTALMQKAGCLACHSVDNKILGPSYKDVAAKYKGQKVTEKLVAKVKDGGSGVWGAIPMPPNTGKMTDAEFKSVVEWILSL